MIPSVAAIVIAVDADRALVPQLVAELSSQVQVVLVDATRAGDLEIEGTLRVRDSSYSRGRALLSALHATSAEWFLWAEPGAHPKHDRAERQLAAAHAQPGVQVVTSDIAVEEPGRESDTLHRAVDLAFPEPPAFWKSGVLIHRDALASIDTTTFAPVELALVEQLRAAGAAAHLGEATSTVAEQLARHRDPAARLDARLLHLAASDRRGSQSTEGAGNDQPSPTLTVFLACHERMDVLPDCLAGFARQLVPPGTLEIIVCDDGSTDETLDFLQGLDLAVPLRFTTGPNAGACAARNRGLHLIRGRYVLFVNDDTVPAPDLVARHLAAHRALGGRRACVLGTFEQPDEPMESALTRVLEKETYVFGYPGLKPGVPLDGTHFYTCNVSLPAEAVAAVGSFDEDFPWYTEDTEFGVRLEALGYSIYYRPEARAWHFHPPTLDALKRRQPAVAKAHVKLFAKHPLLVDGGQTALTAGAIRESHRVPRKHLGELEDGLRTLGPVNLARLEEAGGAAAELAERIESSLSELFGKVNAVWWHQGIEDGLTANGLRGFADLAALHPTPLAGGSDPFVLLHPSNEQPDAWIAAAEAWLAEGSGQEHVDATLVVVAEEVRGISADVVAAELSAILRRRSAQGQSTRPVAIVEMEDNPGAAVRLLAAAEGWLRTGAERDDEDRGMAVSTCAPELDAYAAPEPTKQACEPHALLRTGHAERLLAWPRWTSVEEVQELTDAVRALSVRSGTSLVLLHHHATDGSLQMATAMFHAAWRRSVPQGAPADVRIEAITAGNVPWERLSHTVDAYVGAGGDAERRAQAQAAGLLDLGDRDAVAAWLQRRREPVEIARVHPALPEVCHA